MSKWQGTGVLVPCVSCQELTDAPRMGRCHECHSAQRRIKERGRKRERTNRTDRTGPTSTRWKRLRARVVSQQDWCSDCHESRAQIEARGDRIEVDHTPAAWHREALGKAIRLEDVDVVCGQCNRARGPAGVGTARYEKWINEVGADNA